MKAIRWPECDVLESDMKTVDDFYTRTDKGILLKAFLFPFSQRETLINLKSRIEVKKKELLDLEGEIYEISRDFNA
jgi:hypothetical protein